MPFGWNIASFSTAKIEKTLLFAIIILLPTQLGKHFWPEFSFVYSLPIDYLSPTLYFWDILVVTLLGLRIFKRVYVNKKALIILALFLLSQLISIHSISEAGQSLVRIWQYVVCGLFGVYIASLKKAELKTITLPLSISLIFESTLGVLQVIKGGTLGIWILGERTFDVTTSSIATFDWYGQVFLRAYGTFPHPNVLAGFMVIATQIVLYLNAVNAKLKLLTLCCATLSILLSFSRGGILVLFVNLFFFLRTQITLLIFLFLILYPIAFVRFESIFNFDNMSIIRRSDLAENSITFFISNPLLGIGLNNFIPTSAELGLISGTSRFFQPAHSIFLLTLAETGIVGLLGLLFLITYPLLLLFKIKKPDRYLVLNLYLVIFFLGSLDHYFITLPQGQRIFFLVWGLSMLELSGEHA